ncbi:MAG: hypothetical protein DDT42_02056 [candidate division WS2 bacterium]|uniref:Uncharacterized protein n=1 Tax=Psychracetigena formicireducens TaxID=2986056 RepID=A0A9E2F245_PSYF1|nr:hypothetical protein [Candidatus Psychracetigena formicireducens]MBT9146592.1 hypothetical protein [Bacillota bacterium]
MEYKEEQGVKMKKIILLAGIFLGLCSLNLVARAEQSEYLYSSP